jgi:hypothetical protein
VSEDSNGTRANWSFIPGAQKRVQLVRHTYHFLLRAMLKLQNKNSQITKRPYIYIQIMSTLKRSLVLQFTVATQLTGSGHKENLRT